MVSLVGIKLGSLGASLLCICEERIMMFFLRLARTAENEKGQRKKNTEHVTAFIFKITF